MLMSIKPINKSSISIGRKERDKDKFSLQACCQNASNRLTKEYI